MVVSFQNFEKNRQICSTMKFGEKPNLKNYSVFFETLYSIIEKLNFNISSIPLGFLYIYIK
jgi:hypothetical protein